MKLSTTISAAVALLVAPAVLAQTTVTVSYDQTYDNASGSMDTVSCSDGPNGLDPPYSTFGSLPDFPYIGGAAAVSGWGSAECGTCWQLTYEDWTINVLAIDHTAEGFNIALEAMNALTDNQAEFLGRVNAVATQVDASVCGL
ncbi:Epl1 protein [Wolfiporia cocos MD-104 SS10]|uniref:Epl1 protein n=1 Tax=Wolfiporia cocos (strain MD-104) TaxID=742152 RepID=A0A2H3JGZ0_WOLCO|nr:Epl1 protein [Wolfiporia cocos MD-104 SS10]